MNGAYIINLQNSNDGNGTHWYCLYIENKHAMYFDSYGGPPPKEVVKFFKRKKDVKFG